MGLDACQSASQGVQSKHVEAVKHQVFRSSTTAATEASSRGQGRSSVPVVGTAQDLGPVTVCGVGVIMHLLALWLTGLQHHVWGRGQLPIAAI